MLDPFIGVMGLASRHLPDIGEECIPQRRGGDGTRPAALSSLDQC